MSRLRGWIAWTIAAIMIASVSSAVFWLNAREPKSVTKRATEHDVPPMARSAAVDTPSELPLATERKGKVSHGLWGERRKTHVAPPGAGQTLDVLLRQRGLWDKLEHLLVLCGVAPDSKVDRAETLDELQRLAVQLMGKNGEPVDKGFCVDIVTGEMLTYSNDEDEDVPKGWQQEKRLPAEAILQKATEIKQALGLSYELSDKDLTYDDRGNNGHGTWMITVLPEYKGITGAGLLRLVFSAYSGTVRRIANMPLRPPDHAEQNLTKKAAQKIAQTLAKEKGFSGEPILDVHLSYVFPNSTWAAASGPSLERHEMHLAWVVTFGTSRDDSRWVYVDAGTGEILGGDFFL